MLNKIMDPDNSENDKCITRCDARPKRWHIEHRLYELELWVRSLAPHCPISPSMGWQGSPKQKDMTLLEFEVVVVAIAVKSETEHLKNVSCRSGEIEQGLRCLSCRETNLVRSSH